jgi:hypothetical protein
MSDSRREIKKQFRMQVLKEKTSKVTRMKSMYISISVFLICSIVFILRRPDMITNPQPWAEDGSVFISEALSDGLHSIFIIYAGYYHLIPRIVTYLSIHFSISLGQGIKYTPLFMNMISIIISVSCAMFITTNRFEWIATRPWRILIALSIIVIPTGFEIFGTITNVQWWLGYFQFLITWDIVGKNRLPKGYVLIVLFFASFSGPMGTLPAIGCIIFIIKFLLERKAKYKEIFLSFFQIFFICIGVVVEITTSLIHRESSIQSMDKVTFVINYIRVLFAGVFARSVLPSFQESVNYFHFPFLIFLGMLIILIIIYSHISHKRILILPFSYIALLLAMSSLGSTYWLAVYKYPFVDPGVRYFFVPVSIMMTLIIAGIAKNDKKITHWVVSIILVAFIIYPAIGNFQFQPLANFNWQQNTSDFDLNGDAYKEVPINPNSWTFKIPIK